VVLAVRYQQTEVVGTFQAAYLEAYLAVGMANRLGANLLDLVEGTGRACLVGVHRPCSEEGRAYSVASAAHQVLEGLHPCLVGGRAYSEAY
jgi:hypothetical protein